MIETLTALILAGGRSSRMGYDKATIMLDGMSLLDRAIDLAHQAGATSITILGRPDHPLGVADNIQYGGPARAISAWASGLQKPTQALVIPIDMPLLTPEILSLLIKEDSGGYFEGHYLPFTAHVHPGTAPDAQRIQDLLRIFGVRKLTLEGTLLDKFTNINDPQALKKLLALQTRE
ncbi:MAG: molybdenum cofactor guanylyltransferase [Alphaproteobacteria bacterium]|nr:molybdenum cofactor guanylyltransferase [Alphaproteobacteria bacterium]